MPRFSVNNNNTYPNNNIIIGHRIFYANLAGLLMHCPGLVVKWEYEDLWPEYIQSICGASVEGCFLLLLATGTYNVGYHFYVKLDKARNDNTNRIGHLTTHNKQEQHCHKLFIKAYILIIAILLPIWYFSFIIFSILGDATYRKMTGNGNPSVGILQAGFSDARSNIMAQITYEGYVGTIVRFTFSVLCLLSSILVYSFKGGGSTLLLEKKSYHHATTTTTSGKKNGGGRFRMLSCLLIGYGIALYWFNLLEWYTPVAQVCVAYMGTFHVKEQKNFGLYHQKDTLNVNHSLRNKQQHQEQKSSVIRAANNNFRPNIIFLQHESLSGAIMLKTQEGINATPFFHDKMHNDTNFYVFEKTHTGSGNTIDAMPALLTGCLPHTLEGVDWVRSPGRSIGYDFSLNGYATASFSSTAHGPSLKWENGNYYMLYDLLVGGMDTVKEPLSMGYRMENADAVDDRKILPLIEEWLSQLNATQMDDEGKPTTLKQQRKPFYAQWYQTNAHYPYFKDDEIPSSSNRYFDSLKTVDLTLKGLFEILEKTNHLHDTIIIGSGDHGEDPFKDAYVRVCSLNSNVLQTLSYIYYPKNLMSDPTVADRLRKNTQKMTHILDMYPTILSIANDGHYNMLLNTPDDCITGLDLTADIPDDRVTFSINLGSSDQVQPGRAKDNIPWQAQLWALSTMDPNGRELSLYYRRHKFDHPATKQGKDNLYILEYGDCLRNISISNLCMKEFDDENKQIFRNSIQWLKNSPLYHAGIKNSKVVETFANSTMNGTLDRVDDQAGNQHDSYSNILLILRTLTGFSALGCIVQHKLKSYLASRVFT